MDGLCDSSGLCEIDEANKICNVSDLIWIF